MFCWIVSLFDSAPRVSKRIMQLGLLVIFQKDGQRLINLGTVPIPLPWFPWSGGPTWFNRVPTYQPEALWMHTGTSGLAGWIDIDIVLLEQ